MYVGIDVAADCLHCVAIDDDGAITDTRLIDESHIPDLAEELTPARVVAIDAPQALSTRPHLTDPDPRLSPKFRVGRCAEIDLQRNYRISVPWVTPSARPVAEWMETGFHVFEVLAAAGVEAIEVYPHAAFRVLWGSRPPRKSSADGVRVRVGAVTSCDISGDSLLMWSHDGLDALVGALVARDHANGVAIPATCGHDESAIWLPAHEEPPRQ